MTQSDYSKDLVVLVADKDMEHAVDGILSSRFQALGIRRISSDFFVHPHRDPGCLIDGHEFLRPFTNSCHHALVMLDREGCGQEPLSREALEEDIESRLRGSGWGDRAAAIVLDPELEIWVWSDSPHVASILGWSQRTPDLAGWLRNHGFLDHSTQKPDRPKEALEQVLKLARKPRSPSLYTQLAKKVSLGRCSDPGFSKFKRTLRSWFSESSR